MTTLKIKRHTEINEGYQGFNLMEFIFDTDDNCDNDQIIDTFIRSIHFSFDCLSDLVKKLIRKLGHREGTYDKHLI